MALSRSIRSGFGSMMTAILAALLIAACGGEAGESSETSAVTFQIAWDRSGGSSFQPASLADCADVATVSAIVFSTSGAVLATGGPWNCTYATGTISEIPSNRYATIAVSGNGFDGLVWYHGETSQIFLAPGRVDAGVITAGRFVPSPVRPADLSTVDPRGMVFQWMPVSGAAAYRIVVAEDDALSSIVRRFDITGGAATSVRPDVTGLAEDVPYFWYVQAVDAAGNLGSPSVYRQFRLHTTDITHVVFTQFTVAASPITTRVSFGDNVVDYSRSSMVAIYEQWTVDLSPSDMLDLAVVIDDYALYAQGDVLLDSGCVGSDGMSIEISGMDVTINTFFISGQVMCDPASWPQGVRALVELKDALVVKYRPSGI